MRDSASDLRGAFDEEIFTAAFQSPLNFNLSRSGPRAGSPAMHFSFFMADFIPDRKYSWANAASFAPRCN